MANYVTQDNLSRFASKIDDTFARKTSVPTKTSDLTNDSDFTTTTAVATAISNAIAGITQFDYEIVQSLPGQGVKGKIYLIANSGAGSNVYDEYIWISTDGGTTYAFELIGTREVEAIEYIGSATITISDGTGANAGKKIINVKYDSDDFAVDSTDGLQLSSTVKASLAKADTALQSADISGVSNEFIDALWTTPSGS